MLEDFAQLNPTLQAFFAALFTWSVTALGSAIVFAFKTVNRRLMDCMMGFAAGVMIAASFWSLLAPAIEMAEAEGMIPWLPAVLGFMGGGAFLWSLDKVMPHLHVGFAPEAAEGMHTRLRRSILLVLAITLHNIPEGLAVGVAFGAVAAGMESASLGAAIALAVGIAIQNFPEGAAVSMPLRGEGFSRGRAFIYGQASGAVEPVAAMIGAASVMYMRPMLPFALAFAAGAMIYVVVEELIPESQLHHENTDLATLGAMGGFSVMMWLDVSLG